jgi:L-ascorbate metabolism protein UlaG (beta-lactamase superfamily)
MRRLLGGFLALVVLAAAAAPSAPLLGIHYVANAGVLVRIGDARFLIDAPIRDGIPPYATSDAATRGQLEAAQPPFDRVDAILVTHWHEDHFSAEAVAAHLTRNPRAVLVSSFEVAQRVRALAPALADRLKGVVPLPGTSQAVTVAGVPVRVLRIRHNPARRFPEQHVGFLLGTGPTVLHTGDADPTAENFALLRALPKVDVAFLPFWYVQNADNARFVRESIAPGRIFGMHLPPADAEKVQRQVTQAGTGATLLVRPGTIVE